MVDRLFSQDGRIVVTRDKSKVYYSDGNCCCDGLPDDTVPTLDCEYFTDLFNGTTLDSNWVGDTGDFTVSGGQVSTTASNKELRLNVAHEGSTKDKIISFTMGVDDDSGAKADGDQFFVDLWDDIGVQVDVTVDPEPCWTIRVMSNGAAVGDDVKYRLPTAMEVCYTEGVSDATVKVTITHTDALTNTETDVQFERTTIKTADTLAALEKVKIGSRTVVNTISFEGIVVKYPDAVEGCECAADINVCLLHGDTFERTYADTNDLGCNWTVTGTVEWGSSLLTMDANSEVTLDPLKTQGNTYFYIEADNVNFANVGDAFHINLGTNIEVRFTRIAGVGQVVEVEIFDGGVSVSASVQSTGPDMVCRACYSPNGNIAGTVNVNANVQTVVATSGTPNSTAISFSAPSGNGTDAIDLDSFAVYKHLDTGANSGCPSCPLPCTECDGNASEIFFVEIGTVTNASCPLTCEDWDNATYALTFKDESAGFCNWEYVDSDVRITLALQHTSGSTLIQVQITPFIDPSEFFFCFASQANYFFQAFSVPQPDCDSIDETLTLSSSSGSCTYPGTIRAYV